MSLKRVVEYTRNWVQFSVWNSNRKCEFINILDRRNGFQQNRNYEINSSSFQSAVQNDAKGRILQGKSNHKLGGKILEDIRVNFDYVCSQVTKKSTNLDPLSLIYFPRAFIAEGKVDRFTSTYWPIWWDLLKQRLYEVEDSSIVSDLFFILAKLNRDTNGDFVKKFGWENIQLLADIALRDVKSLYAKKFETFVYVLEQSILSMESKPPLPIEWLNTNLYNGFNAWVRLQYVNNNPKTKTLVNKHLGRILVSLANMGVRTPSDHCLKMLTQICSRCFYATENSNNNNSNLSIIVAFNLSRFADAFLKWNVNSNNYCNDFWLNWFKAVNHIQRMTLTPRGSLMMTLLIQSFNVMVKFQCVNEFRQFKEQWGQLVHFNVDKFPLDSVKQIVDEIDRIYAKDKDFLYQLITRDVIYVLDKRCQRDGNRL